MSSRSLVTGALARAAGLAKFETAPVAVRERVTFLISDVLSVIASACQREEIQRARRSFSFGSGPCTIVGSDFTAAPTTAALLNGFSVAAEQLQDGHRLGRGHPASHVVPAVFAVAEATDASGESMLSAVLAGYEVGVHIGIAMGGTPDGVHDIGTWGTIGAAAGVAHLLSNGSPDVIGAAIELAASAPLLPDAATVFGGSTGQHAFLGVGTQLGVVWGSLASSGLRAPVGTLENHFAKWSGRDFDPSLITDAVGLDGGWMDWTVLRGYVKRHPTCAHLHGVNDAVESILEQWLGSWEEIESVVVDTYAEAAVFDEVDPTNDLAARFSIPFTVAVALVTRRLDNASFGKPLLEDSRVRSLSRRIEVHHRGDLDAQYPAGRPAAVSVRLSSGVTVFAEVSMVEGDGVDAMRSADVLSKPRSLLMSCVPEKRANELLSAVGDLFGTPVASLTAVLRHVFDED